MFRRADFMYMAPPFLAYYAVDTYNASLLADVVQLCAQYRQVLHANITGNGQGVWEHIIGPQSQDVGQWSTGNGWAAGGMVRVLATVMKAPASVIPANQSEYAVTALTGFIKEIIDGAMSSPVDTNGFLRNYLNDTSGDGHGYGEISGTSMLAAATYRMAVLCPQVFDQNYTEWADGVRETLGNGQHVSQNGTVYPAVNPLNWGDTVPYTAGSPEGNNFVVLMYAAWRDCVQAGVCFLPGNNTPQARRSLKWHQNRH
jgi:Glycosyl Hydrolase Family 88